jgi:tripartite-type tricarboxylate transporter receptor subunit TctC
MKMLTRQLKGLFVPSCALILLIPPLSFAQEFPTKPINILVSAAPGGAMDTCIRVIGKKIERALGQPVVISNNGGAAGSVALTITANENPDGYHISCTSNYTLVWAPNFRKVNYKLEDFVPICLYGTAPIGLVVRTDSPWKTLKEFVEYAKKNPGKITYSTTGVGTAQHITMEYIAKQEGGIQWTNVPFTGGNVILPVLGGHVSACVTSSAIIPHVKEGTLRLLATTGEKRWSIFPDVPTIRELGYDFNSDLLTVMVSPKGTALSIVRKLDDAFAKTMDDPEFSQVVERLALQKDYRNHEEAKTFLEKSNVVVSRIISEVKIQEPGTK